MVRPVQPVSEIRIASSRSVSGVRGSSEVQLIEPASIELPRLTRCVRRCQIELSSGRSSERVEARVAALSDRS